MLQSHNNQNVENEDENDLFTNCTCEIHKTVFFWQMEYEIFKEKGNGGERE